MWNPGQSFVSWPFISSCHKRKNVLTFSEILISLSFRDKHCILRPKPSMLAKHIISKLYSKEAQLFGLKGNYPSRKYRYKVTPDGN